MYPYPADIGVYSVEISVTDPTYAASPYPQSSNTYRLALTISNCPTPIQMP